jgi:hypothetical protein
MSKGVLNHRPIILETTMRHSDGVEQSLRPVDVVDSGRLGWRLLLLATDALAHHGRLSRVDRAWADHNFRVPLTMLRGQNGPRIVPETPNPWRPKRRS